MYYSATKCIGDELVKYLDDIINENVEENDVLYNTIIIKNGEIIDKRIIDFQKDKHCLVVELDSC